MPAIAASEQVADLPGDLVVLWRLDAPRSNHAQHAFCAWPL